MCELIGKQRDALILILLEGLHGMPGCLGYGIAQDPSDADAIGVTEAWSGRESHQASLSAASVRPSDLTRRAAHCRIWRAIRDKTDGWSGARAAA